MVSIEQRDEPRRKAETVTYVVFGVLYIIVTLLWLWVAPANRPIDSERFDQAMRAFGEFFAVVAAPLWFFTTLNQLETFRSRVAVLTLGLCLLIPLPLFLGVSPL
jgi:hypothetical protein